MGSGQLRMTITKFRMTIAKFRMTMKWIFKQSRLARPNAKLVFSNALAP